MENAETSTQTIVRSVRGDQETFDKFADFCKENGITQGTALNRLLDFAEAEKNKLAMPGSKDDIEAFEKSARLLYQLYITAISSAGNAKDLASAEYRTEIAQAKKEIGILHEAKEALAKELAEAKRSLDDAKHELANVIDAANQTRTDLKQKLQKAEQLAENLSVENTALKEERSKNSEKITSYDSLNAKYESLKSENSRLINEYEDKLRKAEYEKKFAVMQAKAEGDAVYREMCDRLLKKEGK